MIPDFPTTRTEAYLAAILGGDGALPVPESRTDLYLAKIAGMDTEIPAEPQTRSEKYLAAILGADLVLPAPLSRKDLYLAKKAGMDVEIPEPLTRLEAYLAEWAGGSGTLKTVTGSLIHITDALASPVNALSVNIDPVQDLHGYDNPWPAGGGKNLFDIGWITKKSVSGLAITVSGNTVSISGTATGSGKGEVVAFHLKPGDYHFKLVSNNGYLYLHKGWTQLGHNTNFTVTSESDTYRITTATLTSGADYDISVKEIQIESGSSATSYAPYSNICPISGWDGVNVWVKPTHDTSADPSVSITFPTPPGTVYGGTLDVLSGVLTVDKVLLTFSGGATSEGVYGDDNAELYRLEIPNYNTTKIVRAQSTTSVGKLSSNYFKFISTTSAAKMKDAEIRTQAANTPQYLYFRWDSATDVSAINAAFANTALQVIGELQSPQTYQLTPQEVSTLLGENNIWADTGDTTLTYMARG